MSPGGSLNVAKTEKQDLLETIDVKERLRKVLRLINREIEILELGKQVQANVKTEMDKAQKDYYIREQIKALQKELGEGDERSQEMGDLQNRLLEAELPEAAFKEAERELNRLNRIPAILSGSPGYSDLSGMDDRTALEYSHRRPA